MVRVSGEKSAQGRSGEALFFDLAIEDITRAADLFRRIFDRTCGVDGWVSLEVSALTNRPGIAIGQRAYRAYCEQLATPRLQQVLNAGARPQRLLWAGTGTKDPQAPDDPYVKAPAAPLTVNTMPENRL